MRKITIKIIFIVVLIHFIKDITQDILHIPSIFDFLGNINENLSSLNPIITKTILFLGYLSFFVEITILIVIPIILKNNFQNRKLTKFLLGIVLYLVIYFLSVSFLDPNLVIFN